MAYINIVEWTPDQVTDWLKGLDDGMGVYVQSFTNNQLGGRQLLNIRPYELEHLGMYKIGHQEIVLEAVEHLRNFHYNLDKENLQFMALHLASSARSLHRQLANHCDASHIETHILNDITRTIGTIKPLISWLDRSPFQGQEQFNELRRNMLRSGLVMATIAQRDRFVEKPVEQIKSIAEKLEGLANYIIQDISDPMLLQPASLNLVTIKKRESELGFNIESSYRGIHRVTEIKYNSPAHNSGKIEDGDEIVQINYQTVVGWQYKTVLMQLRELLPDVLLTLKKRPKHTKIYGQIYMQPYRLPSKKRAIGSRWGENLSSPRPGFLTVPESTNFNATLKSEEKLTTTASDSDSSCSDILTPTGVKDSGKEIRLYYPKPRAMLQRRNTICGDELIGMKRNGGMGCGTVPFWHKRTTCELPPSPSLRDKSISFGFGLEIAPRPTTCIGIASGSATTAGTSATSSSGFVVKRLAQVPELLAEAKAVNTTGIASLPDKSKPGVSKVVRFDANMKFEDYPLNEKYMCNVENTILETFEPIPFVDEEDEDEDTICSNSNSKNKNGDDKNNIKDATSDTNAPTVVEAINTAIIMRRGRLDKSHSTPTYDNSGEESDTPPPAIEPRKEFLLQTPPIPPPRPRKQKDLIIVPPPPPKPPNLQLKSEQIMAQPQTTPCIPSPQLPPPPPMKSAFDTGNNMAEVVNTIATPKVETIDAESELRTPIKSRTLTLKKKNSLINKRRNVNLKLLGTGDIQGYLYRRTKDRRGVTFWARLYFVMLDTILYGFRSKEASKSNCIIFLPGFTVSLAKEVHSKAYAFKVYHTMKTFYFATDSQDALNQWIEFIRQATIQSSSGAQQLTTCFASAAAAAADGHQMENIKSEDLFSETDGTDEENTLSAENQFSTPPAPAQKKSSKDSSSASSWSSSSAVGNINNATTTTTTPTTTTLSSSAGSVKQDWRYLGSLRKLTKSTLTFKSSATNEKMIPVPTDQYRSYRKVPGGSFGIQIGTNTPGFCGSLTPKQIHEDTASVSVEKLTIQQPLQQQQQPQPQQLLQQQQQQQQQQRKLSISSSHSSIISNGETTASVSISTNLPSPSSPALTMVRVPAAPPSTPGACSREESIDRMESQCIKKFAYNFIHASNPNLVEFDFQTSKTLDYSLPKINSSNSWDSHQNIQGFVTLKDLMLQKQEEEGKEMYNNRVLLGVEKHDLNNQRLKAKRHCELKKLNENDGHHQKQQILTSAQLGGKVLKTQNRSLPKTPDYEISFKPDDEDIKRTRTKEGLKLRDFGYELISGDEPLNSTISSRLTNDQEKYASEYYMAGHLLRTQAHAFALHKWKKHPNNNTTASSSLMDTATAAGSSEKSAINFKKKMSKFDAIKLSSEQLLPFSSNKHSSSSSGGGGGGIMTLPLKKRFNRIGLDISGGGGGGGGGSIKKSHTYNNGLRDKASGSSSGVVKYENHRKNSAPIPIFSRLAFTSSSINSTNSNINAAAKSSKDKRIMGSPQSRRTIFSINNAQQQQQNNPNLINNHVVVGNCKEREYDKEIFSTVILPKVMKHHQHQQNIAERHSHGKEYAITPPDVIAPPPPIAAVTTTVYMHSNKVQGEKGYNCSAMDMRNVADITPPEYPDMECPPIFEPEMYSLTDTDATLMLRRNQTSPSTTTTTTTTTATSTSTPITDGNIVNIKDDIC